jgi:hypothetical protein
MLKRQQSAAIPKLIDAFPLTKLTMSKLEKSRLIRSYSTLLVLGWGGALPAVLILDSENSSIAQTLITYAGVGIIVTVTIVSSAVINFFRGCGKQKPMRQ